MAKQDKKCFFQSQVFKKWREKTIFYFKIELQSQNSDSILRSICDFQIKVQLPVSIQKRVFSQDPVSILRSKIDFKWHWFLNCS